jgi:hypothetical protein
MLTVAGIMLTAIIFLLKIISEQNWLINLCSILLLLAFLMVVIAIAFFLDVLKVKTFKRIKFESLIFNTELEKESVDVEAKLIATYEEALKYNISEGDAMIKFFRWGTDFIIISLILICIVLSYSFIYRIMEGGKL